MRLSKLYCNDINFKNIKFNLSGLNVIYADVLTKQSAKKNSHDLGKTKLAELIDFLLIKEIDKNFFLLKIKDKIDGISVFNDYTFYLEILLNSGIYLTIRRSVSNHTKTSFSLNDLRSNDFTPPHKWDQENLSIKAAKKALMTYLNFDFFKHKSYDYRKAISYCIRSQQDYEDVYKLSKFKGGKDIDWKPFMFDLLGFEGDVLRKKYENDDEQATIAEYVKKLRTEFSVSETGRDELIAQLSLQERRTQEASEKIDKFNFYDQDKRLIGQGIEEIENKVSGLNTESYKLNYDIDKLQKSIKNNFAFDLNKVETYPPDEVHIVTMQLKPYSSADKEI